MGQISLSLPTVGQPHSTEDVKVGNDFTTIQNVINGNLDSTNLSASAAIAATQLAAGAGRLAVRAASTSITAAVGDQIVATAGNITITLPAPVANGRVGVFVNAIINPAQPVLVSTPSGTLVAPGVQSPFTSLTLGFTGASVQLHSDGSQWFVVAGQQDTGWVAMSLPANWGISGSAYTPAARAVGDRAYLRGIAQNNTGGTASFTLTLGTPFRPAAGTVGGAAMSTPLQATSFTVSSAGVLLIAPSTANGNVVYLDGITYSLVT